MLLDFDWIFFWFFACYKTKNQVETSLKVSIVETSLLGDTHLKVIESDSDTL